MTTQTFGPTDVTTNSDAQNQADALAAMQALSESATTSMRSLAAAQTARTARLTAVRERLIANKIAPATTLQKLATEVAASQALEAFGVLADRISQRPVVNSTDVGVFGNVTNSNNAGVGDVFARITDSASQETIGARVKTNKYGDFSFVLNPCELPTDSSNLSVSIESFDGKQLATSAAFAPAAGSPVYLQISIPARTDKAS